MFWRVRTSASRQSLLPVNGVNLGREAYPAELQSDQHPGGSELRWHSS